MKRAPLKSTGIRGLVTLLALCALSVGRADSAPKPNDIDVQHFRPAMDSKGLITVDRSKALGTFEPAVGLYLNFAYGPLDQSIDGETYDLVERYGAGNLVVALGFAHIVEIAADLPVVIIRGDADGPGDIEEMAGDGLGDTRLSAKVRILDRETSPVGLALAPAVYFASGASDIFATHGQGAIFAPQLILDWDLGSRVAMAINGGVRLADRREISASVEQTQTDRSVRQLTRDDPIIVGKEVLYSGGVGVTVIHERLDLIAEAYGRTPIESGAKRATPLEALLGLKIYLVGDSFLSAGVTRGLLGAYGDPDLRLFAGIVFEPKVGDRDGDGLLDDVDQCPYQPEDKDGFQDADGCPEPDNDQDGILDEMDLCPNVPEDFNGYEDRDGCPDGERDRDGDGILDHVDQCPDEPEDRDNFEDEDGCPDLDNDRDSILDTEDQCPNVPEDFDSHQDHDGCPDPDNDGDGIADRVDRCPDVPENFDGVEDEDGCPESKRKVIISGGKINILDKIFFETNKATIRIESYEILSQVSETLRQNVQITKLEIQGHTDSRGSESYNQSLSDSRAASVRQFLIDRGEIAPARLVSAGYGESRPLDPSETAEAWAKNRRVEFVILEEDGQPLE